MKKTSKKINRKALVKKLDKIISEIVRERDRRCVTCGSTQSLTNGHLFSRVAYSTRWDLDNCFTQCWGCNLRHEYDPYKLTNYYIELNGKKRYDELHRKFVTPQRYTNIQLVELYESLTCINR